MSKGQARLAKLLKEHPYLEHEQHYLNSGVLEVREALATGTGDPVDLANRLEAQIEAEEKTLAAAFRRFDHSKKGQLRRSDVEHMSKYLGFPHSKEDIDKLLASIDKAKTGTVTFPEFCDYVRRMGGSQKLFEERRKRIAEKGGLAEGDPELTRMALKDAGIDEDAQAYWRLVVSPNEFAEAGKLVPCQAKALQLIRGLAKRNHEAALPKIQKRLMSMKDQHGKAFKDEHLWMTLAWIRELAPVIIHVNLDKVLQFMENDTHYRNQFETSTSGGLLKPAVREKWERDLFGGKYEKAKGFDRPKYGVLNVMNDYRGVVKCKQYGDSYFVLKDARLRCTFSPEDSANLKSERLAVLDFYAHVLYEYSDDELKETIKVANSIDAAVLGDSERVGAMKYKEAQIHGEVCFSRHVERLVVAERHRVNADMVTRIKAVCEFHGWHWGWRDKEQERLKKEDVKGMAPTTWEERLQKIEDCQIVVEEGYCKVGCGRPVQPGVTRANRPFTTCCKGCVMGFGHDMRCGQVNANMVGPGLCKHGCGRKAAKGVDSKGRPLDTCCRACALGLGFHDETCGQVAEVPAYTSGVDGRQPCRSGCGRLAAPGLQSSGRPWAHCCKGCATGKGCDASCTAEFVPGAPLPAKKAGFCTPAPPAAGGTPEPQPAESPTASPKEEPPPGPVVVTAPPAHAPGPSGGEKCCVLS